LKYASPGIPESDSRGILDPIPGILARELRIRWVSAPVEEAEETDAEAAYPVPDDAALRGISVKVSGAAGHMERVENAAAGKLLSEAEKEARGYRFTETTRPFLAEIFLRMGILKLREGDPASAETLLCRSRALRPGFSPDPAMFPPQVIAAWENAKRRPLPETELLVQSLPSGAGITVDGEYKGKTPSRIRPGKTGPVRIRVSHKGYRDAEKIGQWLPGDTETLGFTLSGDRVARLGDLLSDGAGQRGKGAGPLISEFAAAAGAGRVAVLTLERNQTGEPFRVRAYSRGAAGGDPVFLGEMEVSGGSRGAETCGEWAAGKLRAAGWPDGRKEPEETPWYRKWWVWGILISGAGVAAALGGGGGGSSGSGGGSVAVNF
jgi:hypothetical protein